MKKTYIAPQTLEEIFATTSLMTNSVTIPEETGTTSNPGDQQEPITEADSRMDRRCVWDDEEEDF